MCHQVGARVQWQRWLLPLLAVCLAVCLGVCLAGNAPAAELDGFAGGRQSDRSGAKTYTWGIEYREAITEHWSGSFLWLNEGHLPHNHRDGQAVQAWWRTRPTRIGLSLEFGLGPYLDYDTHVTPGDPDSEDRHGWGGLASADVRWAMDRNWSAYLRLNEVESSAKHGSTGLVLGVAYVFGPNLATLAARRVAAEPSRKWELDALLGTRIVNSFQSEGGGAEALELRLQLGPHIAATAMVVSGQDTALNWKDGLAIQFWLEQALSARLRAGVGAGAFVVGGDSSLHTDSSPGNLTSAFSVTIAYAFTPRWLARIAWTRLGTGDDHDCDLLLAGAGYAL